MTRSDPNCYGLLQPLETMSLDADALRTAKTAEAAAEKQAVEKPAAEKVAAKEAASLGLLQPLEALSLDADTLRRVTAAAVDYCDAQGAASVADLVERASRLIAHQQAAWPWNLVLVALGCGPAMPPRVACQCVTVGQGGYSVG